MWTRWAHSRLPSATSETHFRCPPMGRDGQRLTPRSAWCYAACSGGRARPRIPFLWAVPRRQLGRQPRPGRIDQGPPKGRGRLGGDEPGKRVLARPGKSVLGGVHGQGGLHGVLRGPWPPGVGAQWRPDSVVPAQGWAEPGRVVVVGRCRAASCASTGLGWAWSGTEGSWGLSRSAGLAAGRTSTRFFLTPAQGWLGLVKDKDGRADRLNTNYSRHEVNRLNRATEATAPTEEDRGQE